MPVLSDPEFPNGFSIGVAPWVFSGYGHQVANYLKNFLSAGFSMRHYAYRGLIGTSTRWPDESGALVLPQGRMSKFGWEILPYYINREPTDFVFSLCNLFIFDEVKRLIAQEGWPWFHWTPIDCAPMSAPDFNILNISGIKPIAMSRFGQAQLRDWGFPDAPYVPHSIDTSLFRPPTFDEHALARSRHSIADDVFVIGINGANESSSDRKAFSQQLVAFSNFHRRHPKSLLYMWCVAYRHPVGLDLISQMTRLEIIDSVMFPNPDQYNSNAITNEELRDSFYWACDVGSHTSKGEGFGLPAIEFQSCGRPIVVTNCSTLPEITAPGGYGGLKVPGQLEWSTLDSSYWLCPSIDAIEDAYELLYRDWRHRQDDFYSRQTAARFHILDNYDTRRVFETHWPAVFDHIQSVVRRRKSDQEPPDGSPTLENSEGPALVVSAAGREAPENPPPVASSD